MILERTAGVSFLPRDWGVACIAALSAFLVYLYTLAPSVTLEDSGEFITAAVHGGVPHPPGYPMWTIVSFLFSHLIPWGNVAWRVNLVSAVFGALATGAFAMLIHNSLRILLPALKELSEEWVGTLALAGALTGSLVLAFSDVMWSQAVITEVYTLNAFFLSLTLLCFYRWAFDPKEFRWLIGTAFVLALGMTNHHTLFFIFPAFFLGVWLVDKSLFKDFLCSVLLASASVLIAFCHLSNDPAMLAVGWRVGGAAVLLVLGIAAASRLRLNGKMIVGVCAATWLGLSIYAYMPLASKTNPPMNWGYARERAGFFHAVNRGQYKDNLAALIKKYIAPVAGVAADELEFKSEDAPLPLRAVFQVQDQVQLYFVSLKDNVSLPVILIALGSLPFARLFRGHAIPWLWFTLAAFFCMSLFQMLIMNPGFDRQSQWVGKTFFLQSHCIFALWVGYGAAFAMIYLKRLWPALPRMAACLPVALFLFPLSLNYGDCEQRGHWFGWKYGVDMLKHLEPDAVVFGGTDPGRFIPTYMIFCEGTQPEKWKRDPSFNRKDIYLITQNALADGTYIKYIRDHYDTTRPAATGRIRQLLGRDKAYPAKPLKLPTDEEMDKIFQKFREEQKKRGDNASFEGLENVFTINGMVSKKIFEDNKAEHPFYIEESFPMPWYYPYATPEGLILKIHPEPLKSLSPETVSHDRAFWDRYTAELVTDALYARDRPAQMAFSKLRCSIGNIYSFRGMKSEAEHAYRQALQLAPDNAEVAFRLAQVFTEEKRYDEALEVVRAFAEMDPSNRQVDDMDNFIRKQRDMAEAQSDLENKKVSGKQLGQEEQKRLLMLYAAQGKEKDLLALVDEMTSASAQPPLTVKQIEHLCQICLSSRQSKALAKLMEKWLSMETTNSALAYETAALFSLVGENKKAANALALALEHGDASMRSRLDGDDRLKSFRSLPEIQRVLKQKTATPKKPSN